MKHIAEATYGMIAALKNAGVRSNSFVIYLDMEDYQRLEASALADGLRKYEIVTTATESRQFTLNGITFRRRLRR